MNYHNLLDIILQIRFWTSVLLKKVVPKGSALFPPDVYPESGYKFTGWTTQLTEATEDRTYTAVFEKEQSIIKKYLPASIAVAAAMLVLVIVISTRHGCNTMDTTTPIASVADNELSAIRNDEVGNSAETEPVAVKDAEIGDYIIFGMSRIITPPTVQKTLNG